MAKDITIQNTSETVHTILRTLWNKLEYESYPNGNSGVSESECKRVEPVLETFGIKVKQTRRGDAYTTAAAKWGYGYLTVSQLRGLKKFVDEYKYCRRTFKITSI